MSTTTKRILRELVIYYFQALAFTVITYGAFVLIWGPIKLTFIGWLIAVMVGFTIGYIPVLIGHIRSRNRRR
jgi:hypothetical protein